MSKNEYNKKIIGKRIRTIRLEKGMTLEEFGKLFKATKSIVYRWENGTSLPNPERLKAIAKIGDTTVEELINVDIDYQNFKKLLIEKDPDIKKLILSKLSDLPYENYKTYNEKYMFSRSGEKILDLISLILCLETPDDKEEFTDFERSKVYSELVTQLMSEDFSYYWNFAYDLCYLDTSITHKNYIEDTFLKFILEVFSKNEKYIIPLIQYVLYDTKETIKDITMAVVKRTDNTLHKKLSKGINYDRRNALLDKIDDIIKFANNLKNK